MKQTKRRTEFHENETSLSRKALVMKRAGEQSIIHQRPWRNHSRDILEGYNQKQ